ncbi:hypothetical protein SAMN05216229_102168 [Geopseudomonas sagittaria]|uniref:Uncharacterized protein n=1 Tax=Geopseudomonas sagittaria TaxID=1135990 RepID=A0A1I5Q395_9GAMM|nr:hypothetical protein [Pseudomonas sagittaria]SFP40705.1 hypothetical protein SAMN05216229_102168 [Pseudomonas sagittaria]
MHNAHSKIAALLGLGLLAGSVQAALNAVDPGPYSLANGHFAAWYQDTHGRTLDLCLSKAVSTRVPGTATAPSYMCSLLPSEFFDDTQTIAFPGNFPDEAFWFTADALIQQDGIDLSYGAALEAAFNGGEPKVGDQTSFARIRIRVTVPTIGIYTVTHPYGVEVFDVTTTDTRAINMTRDIGIGAPGVYSGALTGDVGPFLRSTNGPYVEQNPDTFVMESFIGDPNLPEPVTGSPFGTNYVRIEGPGIDLRTDVFAVSGKLSAVTLPTPLVVDRATYSRSAGAAQQDVFALAPPPAGTARFADSAGVDTRMSEVNGWGAWYGQSASSPAGLPTTVTVTADNSAAIPTSTPTSKASPLTDLVVIRRAEYVQTGTGVGQLTVEAASSDETALPVLTLTHEDGTPIGTLAGDGPVKTLTTAVNPFPPARITVTSANGGSDSEDVLLIPGTTATP